MNRATMRLVIRVVAPLALFVLVALGGAADVCAQSTTRGAVPAPAGIASDDIAFSVDTNPSLLSFVPRYAAVVAHTRTGLDSLDHLGTAAYAAAALSRFGLGVGFDRRVEPGRAVGRLSLALAYSASRQLAFGVAFRRINATGTARSGSTLDLAATYRPSRHLSFAAVASDVLVPLGLGGLANSAVTAALGLYVGFRPFGSEALTTEVGLRADTEGDLSVRLYAGVGLGRAGRIFFVGNLDQRASITSTSMLAGLELRLDGLHAGSSVVAFDDGVAGFMAHAGVDGRATRGLLERDFLLELDLDGSVSTSELVGRLIAFDRARRDGAVVGAVVRLRNTGIGMALAQEFRQAISLLTSSDRPATCVLESPSGAELYACGTATETFVDEAGTIRLLGPSVDLVAYGAVLERAGIHADFVRIGAYKTSPERWTNTSPSEESVAQTTMYLSDAYERLVQDMAADLGVERRVIREAIDVGPHGVTSAAAIGLVDGAIDTAEVEAAVTRLHGRSLPLAAPARVRIEPSWAARPGVGVVIIDGPIVDGESTSIPILGVHTAGADTIVATLEHLQHDRSIHAVVLRIDSPGGSSVASDRIWRAVRRLQSEKPVVASMGSVAASGGYYVASAATAIYADPTTLTGSIGVYYGKFDVAPLADRLGIGITEVSRGANAGAMSMYRPFDDAERARLEELVGETYALFLRRIAEGRDRSVESLDGLAEGRIWSGDRAHALGLIDHLGGLLPSIAHARTLAGLSDDAAAVVVNAPREGLLSRVVSSLVEADGPGVRLLRPIAWLAFANEEGMLALAPFDEGAR